MTIKKLFDLFVDLVLLKSFYIFIMVLKIMDKNANNGKNCHKIRGMFGASTYV